MGQRQYHSIRRIARQRWQVEHFYWEENKPSWWCFFERRRWKKREPLVEEYEKYFKDLCLKRR